MAPADTLADALADLGISVERCAHLLGVGERTVERWKSGKVRVAEVPRALLWAMRYHDRSLVQALAEDYTPAARPMAEWLDRLLWAMERDPTLAPALLDLWLPSDAEHTPMMDLMLLAVSDRQERAAELRAGLEPY